MNRGSIATIALVLLLGAGCPNATNLQSDTSDAEPRDDRGSPDIDCCVPEADTDVPRDDAEADVPDPCGPDECPNDPVDGPVGGPCLDDSDCATGLICAQESVDVFHGEEYFTFFNGYCVAFGWGPAGCDPFAFDSCPPGSGCFPAGYDPSTGLDGFGCFDLCSAGSSSGVPWTTNCDCRDGYKCDERAEICVSGCSNDRECCEIWHDGEGAGADGARQAAEVTLLGPDRCTDTCDPCTWACTHNGCPGGACRIGDPCEHDADCPADGVCFPEGDGCDDPDRLCSFHGGLCTKERCDLDGRECPVGSACLELRDVDDVPNVLCFVPCEAGTQPGDPGFPCRNVGDPGPDLGDYCCWPLNPAEAGWIDGTADAGVCLQAGNFPGGGAPLGSACTADDDCVSMRGLSRCLERSDWPTTVCSAACNEASAAVGSCETDDTVGVASGLCWAGQCWAACGHPLAPLGAASTGCPNDAMACYPAEPFSPAYALFAEGESAPAGFCFPGCTDDADCVAFFGVTGIPCDPVTGFCDIFAK